MSGSNIIISLNSVKGIFFTSCPELLHIVLPFVEKLSYIAHEMPAFQLWPLTPGIWRSEKSYNTAHHKSVQVLGIEEHCFSQIVSILEQDGKIELLRQKNLSFLPGILYDILYIQYLIQCIVIVDGRLTEVKQIK